MAEEPVLFLRGAMDEDAEDVWDDTLLIQMWDKSLEKVKKGILAGMAKEKKDGLPYGSITSPKSSDELPNGSSTSPKSSDELLNDSKTSPRISDKVENKKYGLANGAVSSDSENMSNKSYQKKYHIGQHVRAPYSVDGVEYEAVVARVMPWKESCLVKFIGYGNKEEVFLSDLQKSNGNEAVLNQIAQAKMESTNNGSDCANEYKEEEEENKMELEHEESVLKLPAETEGKNIHDEAVSRPSRQPQMGKFDNKAYSPAPPHSHSHQQPVMPAVMPLPLNTLSHQTHSEHEAYSSMLMSWYLNGYHTGYYEGLKHGKQAATNAEAGK